MANVRLENVTKRFDEVIAVDGVDLDIADGDFMVLLGPSGCGKSTLLRMIAGLEDPSDGTVWIGERNVDSVPAKDRDVAMVFQSYALYPHKTVQANIEFPLKARGVPKGERARSAADAAEILGLTPYLGRKPGALSGGQRQRVALARAIVRRPAVFCMDEPLSNLDAKLRGETRAELVALHRRLSTTFVYVTHDQVEAMTMGSHVAVMSDGVLQQVDTPQRVYDRPATVFVAQFVGMPPMNVLPAGALERGEHLVGVRPEHLRIDPDGELAAEVTLVEHLGHEVLVTVSVGSASGGAGASGDGDGTRQRAVVRLDAASPDPGVGSVVRLTAAPEHRHRFDPVTEQRIDD